MKAGIEGIEIFHFFTTPKFLPFYIYIKNKKR